MLVEGFPTGVFAANCYVVASGPGEECVVVDPGQDAASAVAEVVRRHRLRPAAVLLTHGHLDHMWSVAPVAGAYDATCWVHPSDRPLLSDPLAGLPREWAGALLGAGERFAEPSDVRELSDGAVLELAGLTFVVDHTPGHTSGSVTFRAEDRLLSGDLLFAGSIGRTDLPGGDHAAMLRSLRDKVLPLPDEIVVLPGHGDRTTIGRERQSNPYLRDLLDRSTYGAP
ncbi:MAG TPA: MBL fold metallo-hydrolase [Actinopolymorphaceae bacterium]